MGARFGMVSRFLLSSRRDFSLFLGFVRSNTSINVFCSTFGMVGCLFSKDIVMRSGFLDDYEVDAILYMSMPAREC